MICVLPLPDGDHEFIEADVCTERLASLARQPLRAGYVYNDLVHGEIVNGIFYARGIAKASRFHTAQFIGGDPHSFEFFSIRAAFERAGMEVNCDEHGAMVVAYDPASEHLMKRIATQWRGERVVMASVA